MSGQKGTRLLARSRVSMPMKPGVVLREDYEYVRRGTCNLFAAVEPKAGQRTIAVTAHRGKTDFVAFVED